VTTLRGPSGTRGPQEHLRGKARTQKGKDPASKVPRGKEKFRTPGTPGGAQDPDVQGQFLRKKPCLPGKTCSGTWMDPAQVGFLGPEELPGLPKTGSPGCNKVWSKSLSS